MVTGLSLGASLRSCNVSGRVLLGVNGTGSVGQERVFRFKVGVNTY